MAFRKYANARVVHPILHEKEWDKTRVASGSPGFDKNLVKQATEILQEEFNPKNYLLSHATIVASVDTEVMPNTKLGSSFENGKPINRKTASYRVKASSEQYINSNMDCWDRPVLLASYKTFIGAHNFQEHNQNPDFSKGRIIDAVARDIGDSLYIDILVATNRKHKKLIDDILSGKMNTMSMGCKISGSTCTKCGNWAVDETEQCDCVRFAKGNIFFDEEGGKHRIAELCGDISITDPPAGNVFDDGSWVEVPAFKGAVSRGIINIESSKKLAEACRKIFIADPRVIDRTGNRKAASNQTVTAAPGDDLSSMLDDAPGGSEDDAPSDDAPASKDKKPPTPKSPFHDLEEEMIGDIFDRVRKRLKEDINKQKMDDDLPSSDAPNDTIIKQARVLGYKAALRAVVAASKNDVSLLNKVAVVNNEFGVPVQQRVYWTSLKVGSVKKYPDMHSFLKKCAGFMGRPLKLSEAKTLIRLGSLLAASENRRRQAKKDPRRSK